LEDRLEIVDSKVGEVEAHLRRAGDRRPLVEADDLLDVGIGIEPGEYALAQTARDAGQNNGAHPPTMAFMSGSGPPEGSNPFEGMPLFRDLQGLFAGQGPVNWDIARQVGVWTAAEGVAEANVDPLTRIRFEELARVAELHVADATGLATSHTGRSVGVRPVTRAEWA